MVVQVAADAEGEVDYVSCGVLVVYTYVEEGRKVDGVGWVGRDAYLFACWRNCSKK